MTQEVATVKAPNLKALRAATADCKCVVGVDTTEVCPDCKHKPTCDQLKAWISRRRGKPDD